MVFTAGSARTGGGILHHRFERRRLAVEPATCGENCFHCRVGG